MNGVYIATDPQRIYLHKAIKHTGIRNPSTTNNVAFKRLHREKKMLFMTNELNFVYREYRINVLLEI